MGTSTNVCFDRETLRCEVCSLFQFRTNNDLCRKCRNPLPPSLRTFMQGKLNEKEARVAMLLARTGNAKEVAKTLKKGEQSVKNLLRDIYKKLGIQTGFKSVILGRAALRELMELSARKGRVFKDYPPPASVSFFLDEDEVSFAYSVAEGLSNEALARQFSTGVKEIKAAVKKTYDKLGVSGRLEFSLRVCQEQYYEERAALRRSA